MADFLQAASTSCWSRSTGCHPIPFAVEPVEYGGRVGMNIVPCRIMKISGFILRTDQNEAGKGHHDHTVIKIAAPVPLRDALNLTDGDLVEVEVD